ncbi:PD-(D/E)XK nuclease superfamily domain-containing protein [Ditylenchus destructor]|nr:PD-(D/E)XK nuclease superfamily domain-containing protein [Ditylenchus destructor]
MFDDSKWSTAKKFKNVLHNSNPDTFPYKLQEITEQTPTVHSANNPAFYTHFIVGGAIGIRHANLGFSNEPLFYYIKDVIPPEETAEDQNYGIAILALIEQDDNVQQIKYKAFLIVNEPNADGDTIKIREGQKITEIQSKILEHFSFSKRDNQGLQLGFSHITKITLHKNKDGNRGSVRVMALKGESEYEAEIEAIIAANHFISVDPASIWKEGESIDYTYKDIASAEFPYSERIPRTIPITPAENSRNTVYEILEKDYTNDSPAQAMIAVYKIFQTMSKNFLSVTQNRNIEVKEHFSHGFVNGFLQLNFAIRFNMKLKNEVRTSRGYVDLTIQIPKNEDQKPILSIVEFKNGNEQVERAMEQIHTKGYDVIKPDLVSDDVILLGVAFKDDFKKAISVTLTKFVELPKQTLMEGVLEKLSKMKIHNHGKNVDDKTAREIRFEIVKSLYKHDHTSYNSHNLEFLQYCIIGQILSINEFQSGYSKTPKRISEKYVFRNARANADRFIVSYLLKNTDIHPVKLTI